MLTTTRRRRLMAVLAMPLIVLLAGCGRFTADFEIQNVDTMQLNLDVGIETSWIEGEFASPEEMCEDLSSEDDGVYNEVPFEPYEEDDMWGCRASGTVDRADFGQDFQLSEADGEFHLVIAGDDAAPVTESDLEMIGASGFEFRMSFTFPGAIIESSGGEVDGNTVTYTTVGEVTQGVDIRAEAGGFPWLIVVAAVLVVGFLLLVALAVVGFLIYRSRKGKGGGSGGAGGMGAPAAYAGTAGPAAPDGQGQQWGPASSPPAAPQGDQWSQDPNQQPGPQSQPWNQDPNQPGQPGQQNQPWNQDPNQRPPQNPGW